MNNIAYVVSSEVTPNVNSYKFLVNHDFAGEDMWDCDSEESASESPLAEQIWALGNVEGVFFHKNLVVVHKNPSENWDNLIDKITAKIQEHFTSAKMTFRPGTDSPDDRDDKLELIRVVIEDYIQPALMSHGGFVRIKSLQDNVLTLSMHGACNGCSSADVTLENGIKRMINLYHPEIEIVLAK